MVTTDKHETIAVVDFAATARVGDLPFATGDRVRVVITRENGSGGPRHTPGPAFDIFLCQMPETLSG